MIKEAYCSFEVAKLLKEKGFDVPCRSYFIDNVDYINSSYSVEELTELNMGVWETLRPTHQMVMAWLREEKNIFIVIEPHAYDYINEKNSSYVYSLWVGDNYYENPSKENFPSYEETVEAALKYCLENLI